MKTGEGFLIVYSVDSRTSFEEAQSFYQQILRVKDRDRYPVVLVANKCDLVSERVVSKAEGLQLAQHLGVSLMETSAKLRINVDECFYALVQEIRRYNRARQPSSGDQPIRQKKKKEKKGCIIL
jgi:GTPase KRas protein